MGVGDDVELVASRLESPFGEDGGVGDAEETISSDDCGRIDGELKSASDSLTAVTLEDKALYSLSVSLRPVVIRYIFIV